MGFLGDLALGILNYALSERETGVIFDPDGLGFPFSLKEPRNDIEELLLIECTRILNLTILTIHDNREFYIENDYICGFVVTNGRTTILHGLFGMGKCGLVVTGADAAEILQQIVPVIQKLGFNHIELCDDKIPFHNRDWLLDTKSILESNAHKKIEQEAEGNVQDEDEKTAEETSASAECENPAYASEQFEEIKSLCYDLLSKFGEGALTSFDKKNRMKMLAARLMLADENPEKILVAKKSFAKNCKDDIPLLMYDETLTKNGKEGFLLSNKKMYIGNACKEPLEIDLSEIHSIEAKAKIITSFIAINDIKFETETLLKKQLLLMADFLQKVIPLAIKIE